jgi:uncharacterized protein YecE (DUF72 family)
MVASVCNFVLVALGGVMLHEQDPFYPPNLENSDWLGFYYQIFDYVEIDSSFYRIPKSRLLVLCL